MENRTCNNCKKDFTIESEDASFYAKISVPAPLLCPDCRAMRRYAWRNERTLYRRNCDLCQKSTVTIYHPQSPFKVYCPPCWWGDGWDAKEFARDFDFSRPFFEQFRELQLQVPRIALLTKNSVNSEYTNHCGDNKNCYLTFATFYSENILYSTNLWEKSQDCTDCYLVPEGGTLLYECVDAEQSYNCQFSQLIKSCTDCSYSYDLRGCSNCFLCYNLRNKEYCILNEQYSKEDYFLKLRAMDIGSAESRIRLLDEFHELVLKPAIRRHAVIEQSTGVTGNMVYQSKNAEHIFDSSHVEDVKYGVIIPDVKDSMDVYHVGFNCALIYECHGVVRAYENLFAHLCYDNSHIGYCDSCHNSENLFGCVGLKKSKYFIFNKQYTPEEYEVLKAQIIEHMKTTGEYGEFFPAKLSPFGYNETQGAIYMPMTRDEALAKGFNWQDEMLSTKGKETIQSENIPDRIDDVEHSILKQILKCVSCERNYNIVPDELTFYHRLSIPIPRKCPTCRYMRRIALRPPRKLWHRQCMCALSTHEHSGTCPNEFETPYAPERTETVYCENCYNKEVL